MREVLRALVSLLVVVTFVAVGALAGILFSQPSGGLGAAAGGGHGVSTGFSLAHQQGIVLVGAAFGFFLALGVVWGICRNHTLSRWFGAISISALAILLACLIPVWHYPLMMEFAALLVPVLCAGFLYAEAKAARQADSSAGA
jgi:hypothetical protein